MKGINTFEGWMLWLEVGKWVQQVGIMVGLKAGEGVSDLGWNED